MKVKLARSERKDPKALVAAAKAAEDMGETRRAANYREEASRIRGHARKGTRGVRPHIRQYRGRDIDRIGATCPICGGPHFSIDHVRER